MASDIQQTGARSAGTSAKKTWASVPRVSVVESTRRLIGTSNACKVSALDVIKAVDRDQLSVCFQRLCGLIGGINVFIPSGDDEDNSVPRYETLAANCSKAECEEALQQIMRDKHDVVSASLHLLKIMNDSMITKVKRVLSESLESMDRAIWYCWIQYIGAELDSMAEEQQQVAVQTMNKWWQLLTRVYDRFAAIVLDVGAGSDNTIDVEAGLKEWRHLAAMTKGAADYEEVFLRERIIFNNYELSKVSGISWEKRRDLLLKLIERKELGLGPILDLKRVELSIAGNYDEWIDSARLLFQLAEVKGMKLALEREKHEEAKKAQQRRAEIIATPAKPILPLKPLEQTMKPKHVPVDVCFICGATGHWANRCPSAKKEVVEKTFEQTKPREQLIPGTGTQRFPNVRSVDPVPKSAPQRDSTLPATVARQPYYQTSSGRNVYKPKSMVTFSESIDEIDETRTVEKSNVESRYEIPAVNYESDQENPVAGDEDGDNEHHQSLRTAASFQMKKKATEMAMPFVDVILESVEEPICGLLDTASNLNYMSRSLFENIKQMIPPEMIDQPKLVLQTMSGSTKIENSKRVWLNAAVKDSSGELSEFRLTPFLIFDGTKIPGGSDILLAADWITDLSLVVFSKDDKYFISLPHEVAMNDKSVQTCSNDVHVETSIERCLLSVAPDGPDLEENDYDLKQSPEELAVIMDKIQLEAVELGPLSEHELSIVKRMIVDPELELCFKPGQEQPPVRELGFPAPWHRQEKLFELIELLEERDILERVPVNSGKFYSPGFGVKKSGDRVRFVVKYVSTNARLNLPKGMKYHDSSQFKEALPSFGNYYVVLDVKDAFYRIKVSEAAQPYLHVSVYHPKGYREYKWKRAPQGLSCSPAFWAQLIDSVVESLKRWMKESGNPTFIKLLKNCAVVVYADDILIASDDPASAQLFGRVLRQTLMFNEMFVPLEKMQEGFEVEINGLRLKRGQYFPKEEIIDKVRKLRRPKDKDELRVALGLMNYVKWSSQLRADVEDTSLNELLDLVHSKRKFIWSEQVEKAWQKYVENFEALPLHAFSTTPGVENLDNYSLVIQSDASLSGIGFATFLVPKLDDSIYDDLSQFSLLDQTDVTKIIGVGSRRLSSAETMYLAHDREALGIHFALSENQKLITLFGRVILQSDSRTALSRYKGNENPKDVIASASTNRGRRWLCWIHDLSSILSLVHWIHVQGRENHLADYLSRYAMADLNFENQTTQTDFASTDWMGEGSETALFLNRQTRINQSLVTTSVEANQDSANSAGPLNVETETPVVSDTNELDSPVVSRLLSQWESDNSSSYLKSIKLRDIYQFLRGERCNHLSTKLLNKVKEICKRRFSLFDNGFGNILLYHNGRIPAIVVPDVKMSDGFPLQTFLIRYIHEVSPLAAHRGRDSCMSILRRTFWFPRMDQAVTAWVNSCLACTVVKSNHVSGTFNSRKLQYVNQLIVCDWAGPLTPNALGQRFCLIIVDAFSGFVYAQPFKNKTAIDAVEGIMSYAALFGMPEKFSSDHDPSFVSELISQFREVIHLSNESIPTYSPATSGSAEAGVKRLKQAISIFGQESDIVDWTVLLKGITFCANATPKYNSNFSSFEIMFGRAPHEPLSVLFGSQSERQDVESSEEEYVVKLKQKLSEISDYWSSKVMEERNKATDATVDDYYADLGEGDMCVRVSYVSGRRRVLGRVRVLKKIEGTSGLYKIFSYQSNQEEIAHGYQLIKEVFHPDRNHPVPAIPQNYDNFYIIEKVLQYCPSKGYLVHWQGFPASERSWQRSRDMPHDPQIRQEMSRVRNQR